MKTPLRVAWLALPVLAPTTPAFADDKAVCLAAASKGQVLRDAHQLIEARDQFRICARQACPALVQEDCGSWAGEVEKGLPTVVITAKDAAGSDLTNVRVSVDGQPLVASLDGQAVAVNPGRHVLVFEGPGGLRLEREALIREGEKNQGVAIVLATGDASSAPSAAPQESGRAATGGWSRDTAHDVALVSGGVGLAGIGVGAVFGLLSISAWSKAKSACGGNPRQCTDVSSGQSYQSTASSDATISNVGFVAGGVLLAAGLVLYFTGHDPAVGGVRLAAVPSVGAGQTGLVFVGSY